MSARYGCPPRVKAAIASLLRSQVSSVSGRGGATLATHRSARTTCRTAEVGVVLSARPLASPSMGAADGQTADRRRAQSLVWAPRLMAVLQTNPGPQRLGHPRFRHTGFRKSALVRDGMAIVPWHLARRWKGSAAPGRFRGLGFVRNNVVRDGVLRSSRRGRRGTFLQPA